MYFVPARPVTLVREMSCGYGQYFHVHDEDEQMPMKQMFKAVVL